MSASAVLDLVHQKTESGRNEIKMRSLALSRSARNLLLLVDGSRTLGAWLAVVQGATEADVMNLLAHQLIAPPEAKTGEKPAATSTTAATAAAPAAPLLSPLGYEQLYGYLTGHAKKYLGLIKGYRMVLDVERCADMAALQQLARRFVQDVEQAQGPAVADQVRQSLGVKP
ncbi:hypothetical protein BH11PSE10_BH11PSE10_07660 [soil metagenome]